MKLVSKSGKETKNFAKKLALDILRKAYGVRRTALVISLEGDLGAGKTTFTQGFAEGLGIRETVQSPTFVILKVYAIRHTPYAIRHKKQNVRHKAYGVRQLIHVDAYRLRAKDFKVLGWKEFIKNPQNIILVEWGNKIKSILPKNTIRILFGHGKKSNERYVTLSL